MVATKMPLEAKKGPKNAPMTSKSIFQGCFHGPNMLRFRVPGTFTRQEFCPKIVFLSHNPKILFFNIFDPYIFEKNDFWRKFLKVICTVPCI